jgi:hypothetical protein
MIFHPRPRFTALATLLLLSVGLAVGFAYAATAPPKPPGASGNAVFPEVDDSWSPDARFVLKNVNTPEDPGSPHAIYLTDMKTGQREVLYTYARRADLIWSPASDALVINDWDANNDAQCMVFILVPRQERIDLRELFLKSRRPEREKRLVADHRDSGDNYAHAIRWLDARTLLFVVQGRSFDHHRNFLLEYTYRLGDSFSLIKRVIH